MVLPDLGHQHLSTPAGWSLQPPEERPYGIEAVARDNSGNRVVLVEQREFTPADFT